MDGNEPLIPVVVVNDLIKSFNNDPDLKRRLVRLRAALIEDDCEHGISPVELADFLDTTVEDVRRMIELGPPSSGQKWQADSRGIATRRHDR